MSADNYIYIRLHQGKYVVTDESASTDWRGIADTDRDRFDDFIDALVFANSRSSEYGVDFGPGVLCSAKHPTLK